MRLFKSTIILLWNSKILLSVMLVLLAFVGWACGGEYKSPIVTKPLGNALTLSIYLFIIMMFVSFEFSRKLYHNGVSEAMSASPEGRKRNHYKMAFVILSIYSLIMTLMITGIVIWEYLFYKIKDPGHEYVIHIIKNMFLNDFLVMEVAIAAGMALAAIKRRILPYAIMCLISIMLSPFSQSIAYMIENSDMEHQGRAGWL